MRAKAVVGCPKGMPSAELAWIIIPIGDFLIIAIS